MLYCRPTVFVIFQANVLADSRRPVGNLSVGNLVLTNELKRKLATVKGKKADVSSVNLSSERR